MRKPRATDKDDPLKLGFPELLKTEKEKRMDSLDRLIGNIEASQAAIKETLNQHRDESRESRAKIYKEIELTNTTILEVKNDLKRMADRLDHVETKLTGFEKVWENIKGGSIVLSFIWAAMGAAVVIFWKWIMAKLTGVV